MVVSTIPDNPDYQKTFLILLWAAKASEDSAESFRLPLMRHLWPTLANQAMTFVYESLSACFPSAWDKTSSCVCWADPGVAAERRCRRFLTEWTRLVAFYPASLDGSLEGKMSFYFPNGCRMLMLACLSGYVHVCAAFCLLEEKILKLVMSSNAHEARLWLKKNKKFALLKVSKWITSSTTTF